MADRCLILANQTLGGADLEEAVRRCIDSGVRDFFVVVPLTPVEHEAPAWMGGFALGEMGVDWASTLQGRTNLEEDARRREAELQEARQRAQRRLDLMIERIEALAGTATGEVGFSDPLEAARHALDKRGPFQQVIVSTLPSGLSRWLRMDLPHRIARATDAPITTVVAEEV